MLLNKKDSVLKKIRAALVQPIPIPFPKSEGQSSVFTPPTQELEIEFGERFTQLQGKFAYCFDEADLAKQLQQLMVAKNWQAIYCADPKFYNVLPKQLKPQSGTHALANCEVAVTGCEHLVARTGSVVLSAADISGRNASVYAPVHICIAYTSQLVYDIKDSLVALKDKYNENIPSLITFATGPSRTADIEKTLVVGVHGPKEVYVFLIENKS